VENLIRSLWFPFFIYSFQTIAGFGATKKVLRAALSLLMNSSYNESNELLVMYKVSKTFDIE
jgi:hypothetical protein